MIERPPDPERERELEALVGRTIAGKYAVRKLLGRGGMGAVYEAEHVDLGKKVALKFIFKEHTKDEVVSSRFAREARAASAIESAHIVSVFDTGTDEGNPFIVMELLRGEDLGSRLRKQTRIAMDVTLHIVAQILRGLVRAHEAGIIHRDLKPDNVFLVETDAESSFVKIVDFGISKMHRDERSTQAELALTGRGTVLGTPFYMSPEQAQGFEDIDERTDLYSVGAILYECVTGRPPHTGETYEQVIVSIVTKDPPELRTIVPTASKEISDYVARALARDRTQRFTSARRMLVELHDIVPALRKRVPLDVGLVDTLESAQTIGNADTDHASEPPPRKAPRTDVSWSHADAPVSARNVGTLEKPAKPRVALFAGVAAVLGVVAMAVILSIATPSRETPSTMTSDSMKTVPTAPPSMERVSATAPSLVETIAPPEDSSAPLPTISATLVTNPPHAIPAKSGVPHGPKPVASNGKQGLGQGLELNREMP